MRQTILTLIAVTFMVPGTRAVAEKRPNAECTLVPWPAKASIAGGKRALSDQSRIIVGDTSLLPLARVFAAEIRLVTGLRLPLVKAGARDGDIELTLDAKGKRDAYRLTVKTRAAVIGQSDYAVALGTTALLQTLHADGGKLYLPHLTVEDGPHFPYCGAMLDVARKPFSIDTLKQCVIVCRFYKIRYLHLHLSDENAWVFPSRAFPQLGSGNFAWAGGVRPTVYKLRDLKDLVAYADARGVTLVPEIEMPGHSGQLRGTLPEIFGYRDEAGKIVSPGVINMVSPKAYAALETLVSEVCDVFRSSPFVHIGCDEASPAGIEKMPEVKAFIARQKLDGAGAVFNAFVNRMHAIVKKHGKRAIVWEGAPLEPVAPAKDLIVMPWVGRSGAAAGLVKQGYAVINPPWGTPVAYFDPYLVNGAQLKRGEPLLLGATSLLWEKPEDAAVPFLRHTGALRNEPTYNPGARRGHADFLRRLQASEPLLDRLLHGFTFRSEGVLAPLIFMRPEPVFAGSTTLTLVANLQEGARVRYTLDGSEPSARSAAYTSPLKLRRTTTVKARWFADAGSAPFPAFVRTYRRVPTIDHDAIGAKVTVIPAQPGYPGPGAQGLTDGYLADGDEAGSAGWVGWERGGPPVQVMVDLGRPKTIKTVGAHFLRAAGGIGFPTYVEMAVSDDGKTFRKVATVTAEHGTRQRGWYVAAVKGVRARHLRISPAAGGDWTFFDEVVVNPKLPGPTFRHAALGKPVTLLHSPSAAYSASGIEGLTDGFRARSPDFLNPEWLGVEGKNLEATIDLGKSIDIREVGGHFLQYVQAGIFIPETVDVLVSADNKTFRKVATVKTRRDAEPAYTRIVTAKLTGSKARFVRLVAYTNGLWLFADEVFVNPENADGEK
jgi:hexosaminidase